MHFITLSLEPWSSSLKSRYFISSQNSQHQNKAWNLIGTHPIEWLKWWMQRERGTFELLEEQDKGETNSPPCFPQGLWAGVTRKVALVWKSGWGNIAFWKSWNCQSLYIILILLCFQYCMIQVFNISCFSLIKLLFILLILSPGQKISLLLKIGVYNPLPWIRLSLNTPFSFLAPNSFPFYNLVTSLYCTHSSLLCFSKVDFVEIEHPHVPFFWLELLCRNST